MATSFNQHNATTRQDYRPGLRLLRLDAPNVAQMTTHLVNRVPQPPELVHARPGLHIWVVPGPDCPHACRLIPACQGAISLSGHRRWPKEQLQGCMATETPVWSMPGARRPRSSPELQLDFEAAAQRRRQCWACRFSCKAKREGRTPCSSACCIQSQSQARLGSRRRCCLSWRCAGICGAWT